MIKVPPTWTQNSSHCYICQFIAASHQHVLFLRISSDYIVLPIFILYPLFLSKQLRVTIPVDSSRLRHLSQSKFDLTIMKDITLISRFLSLSNLCIRSPLLRNLIVAVTINPTIFPIKLPSFLPMPPISPLIQPFSHHISLFFTVLAQYRSIFFHPHSKIQTVLHTFSINIQRLFLFFQKHSKIQLVPHTFSRNIHPFIPFSQKP